MRHCPAVSLRCNPQAQAGRAGKLREKREEGEKFSVLSPAWGRGALSAGGDVRAPGWLGEGGCCGCPVPAPAPPQLGDRAGSGSGSHPPAGRSLGQTVPESSPPTRLGYISLDFWGGDKVLAFCPLKFFFSPCFRPSCHPFAFLLPRPPPSCVTGTY